MSSNLSNLKKLPIYKKKINKGIIYLFSFYYVSTYLLYISHRYILRYYTDNLYGLLSEPSPDSILISEFR